MSENNETPDHPDVLRAPPGPSFPSLQSPRLSDRTKPPPLPSGTTAVRPATAEVGARPPLPSAVSGWLVILDGPGRGKSLTLGLGVNSIGRSADNRVVLDFGDTEITAQAHAAVTYDPRGRKFYLQPGPDALHLTYLGRDTAERPVLTPTELAGGEIILLGRTKLKLICLCGPDFNWE